MRSTLHRSTLIGVRWAVLWTVFSSNWGLQEKDVFERYYKQHLAKRLLLQRAADSELEQSLIQRLKVECGGEYTQRFEAMFKDVRVSDDLMEKFRLAEGGALKTR